jgi:hypothetical protein
VKPLICFVCFNRMGSTVLSLLSLLDAKDDFDLYIGDNDSRDKTWDFLQSLKDPRIREVKRFEQNFGEINVLNWSLARREKGQDFIVMENDCRLHADRFVARFAQAFAEIPRLGAASGWIRSMKTPAPMTNDYFYQDTVMGLFTCFRGEVMDRLGYYSEACYIADVEMNYRIRNLLGYTTGYIKTVNCSLIHPWGFYSCEDCKKKQKVCCRSDVLVVQSGKDRPDTLDGDLYCNRFYPTLNRSFWTQCGGEGQAVMQDKIMDGKQVFWDSVYSGNPLPEWQETKRKKFQAYFAEQYRQHLETNHLV